MSLSPLTERAMKLFLNTDIVRKMTTWTIPVPDTKPLDCDKYDQDFDPPSANYLVYDPVMKLGVAIDQDCQSQWGQSQGCGTIFCRFFTIHQ